MKIVWNYSALAKLFSALMFVDIILMCIALMKHNALAFATTIVFLVVFFAAAFASACEAQDQSKRHKK